MPREKRTAHAPLFAEQQDFNEQVYRALKSSPWWMISIAVHVLLFVISSMVQTERAEAAPPPVLAAQMGTAAEAPPEEELRPAPDETEQVHDADVTAKEPVIKDGELSDHNETDNDMPTEEIFGDAGLSDSPFEGPSTDNKIGLGGGAGSPFGKRGGHRNLRAPTGSHK